MGKPKDGEDPAHGAQAAARIDKSLLWVPCHPWEHGNRLGRTKAKKVLISSSSSAAKTHTAIHPPKSTANAKDASPDSTETRLKLWSSRSCKPQKPLPLALSHWQPLQRQSFTRLRVSEGLLKTTEATEKVWERFSFNYAAPIAWRLRMQDTGVGLTFRKKKETSEFSEG